MDEVVCEVPFKPRRADTVLQAKAELLADSNDTGRRLTVVALAVKLF